ncbi:MAG: hypothetical protein Tsb004_15510 [Allomuricauda sp.]
MTVCEQDLDIGNGLAVHPKSNQIFISKPTNRKDKNNKNQYSLFEVIPIKKDSLVAKELRINSEFTDYHPVFSSKGDFILFNSTRPKPDENTSNGKVDIYFSKLEENQFSEPTYLDVINTAYHDSYPTLTKTNKLYFNSDRPGGEGMMDIYVAEYVKGHWQYPQPVHELNSIHSENDLVIAPDEKFIIFNRYLADKNEIDLYVSFNQKGRWSDPKPISSINKEGIWELTPTLSLDGKNLYIEVNGKIKCYRINELGLFNEFSPSTSKINIDGQLLETAWSRARIINSELANIKILQDDEAIFLAIASVDEQLLADVFIRLNPDEKLQLHASMQLGERITNTNHISDQRFNWDNNSKWTANTISRDFLSMELPTIFEFKILKEKLKLKEWDIEIAISSFYDSDINEKLNFLYKIE